MISQPKVMIETMGSDGQCSKTKERLREADGFQFSASTVSTMGKQGQILGKTDLTHEVVQVETQNRESSKPVPNREVVQNHMQESTEEYTVVNRDKSEDEEAAFLESGLGSSCAMHFEAIGGDGDGGFEALGYFISRGRPDKGGVEANRMELEGGGGGIEEPQC